MTCAYRNVPPEKRSSTPVHHFITAGSLCPPPPRVRTSNQVSTAPVGAARLNTTRCALAPRFPKPCCNKTLVRPKAAGALCTMIATKMMRLSELVDLDDDDAPSAIPSAAACMQSPSVVDKDRCGGAGVETGELESSEREYMLLVGLLGACGERKGRVSRRYIRMKPRIRDRPIQACGSRAGVAFGELAPDDAETFVGRLLADPSSSNIPTLPGSVGVLGGLEDGTSTLTSPSNGMTGPGGAVKSEIFAFSSRLYKRRASSCMFGIASCDEGSGDDAR